MNREELYDAITQIREDLIAQGSAHQGKRARRSVRKWRKAAAAAVLAVVCIAGAVLWPGGTPGAAAYAIAQAEYPEMAPYPNENDYINALGVFDSDGFSQVYGAWRDSVKAQSRPEGYADGLEGFFSTSIRQFLSGEGGGSRVYSPLSVYMALGMLAELTDGTSREQILTVLGCESVEALRAQASDVWNAHYRRDGASTSVLASSLWLSDQVTYQQAAIDTLSEVYYASSYRGEMGSDEFNQALREWLNSQTGGLLEDAADEIGLDANTVLALANTVYFRSKWRDEFSPGNTKSGVFHAVSGDMTGEFMHQSRSKNYYWADQFSAVGQTLEIGGTMWFLLPDEGVSVNDLLADDQAMAFLLRDGDWENQKYLIVNQAIPKFDVMSQMDLTPGLQALGITDVFDPAVSDFTPMTQERQDVFLSRAQHDARVMIDEEGCTAAAYTVMATSGASEPPEEEVDFVLDRPFLFAITSDDGLPLFVGVVNELGG